MEHECTVIATVFMLLAPQYWDFQSSPTKLLFVSTQRRLNFEIGLSLFCVGHDERGRCLVDHC